MKGTRHPDQVSPRASQLGWSVRWCRSEPLVEARSRRLLYCPHKLPDLAHEVVPRSPALPVQRGVPVDLDGPESDPDAMANRVTL